MTCFLLRIFFNSSRQHKKINSLAWHGSKEEINIIKISSEGTHTHTHTHPVPRAGCTIAERGCR